MIHLELFKKFEFDHTNKRYKHNPESVLENETHKVLWDFEVQTDHLSQVRRPDLVKGLEDLQITRQVESI